MNTYSIHYLKKSGKHHVGHQSFFGNAQAIRKRAKALYANRIEATVKDEHRNEIGRVWEESGKWNYSINFGQQ